VEGLGSNHLLGAGGKRVRPLEKNDKRELERKQVVVLEGGRHGLSRGDPECRAGKDEKE